MLSSYYFHLKSYLCIQLIIYKQTNECPRKLSCRFPFKLASCGFFMIFIHYVHFIICSFWKCSCWKPWFSRLHSVISKKAIFELFANSCLYCRHIPYLGCIFHESEKQQQNIFQTYRTLYQQWLHCTGKFVASKLPSESKFKEELKNRLRI